jgi:biopolymer transport protein ExbD
LSKAPPAVEESVAVNVVPLVDIMFLLLLFLMVGGDMSHRESTELQLPKADKAKQADRSADGVKYCVINIHPIVDAKNEADEVSPEFRRIENWQFAIGGAEYTTYWALVDQLKQVAEMEYETEAIPGTKDKFLSAVLVTIRADKNAPYGMIQQAMQACSESLLYKIDVGASMPAAN